MHTNHEASVVPAVRRRESLLAAHASPPLASQTSELVSSALPSSSSLSATDAPPPPVTSRSDEIAKAILAGQTVSPPVSSGAPGQPLTADMAKLATAMGGGAGGSTNPIHVLVSERTCSADSPSSVNRDLFSSSQPREPGCPSLRASSSLSASVPFVSPSICFLFTRATLTDVGSPSHAHRPRGPPRELGPGQAGTAAI